MAVLTDTKTFLEAILVCSEKAANIARCCRTEKETFELLIQEKWSGEKNEHFLKDFKTLADVLVQETVKHDLVKQFPSLVDHIFGEESNSFTNQLGKSICVEVASTQEETSQLLSQVLDGNQHVADLLAEVVFKDAESVLGTELLNSSQDQMDLTKVGIWIDPIDSTYEYIHGEFNSKNEAKLSLGGLQCALVLIGVYDLDSGAPIMGIVNQPFNLWEDTNKRWKGKCYWGICNGSLTLTSLPPLSDPPGKVIVTSVFENQHLAPKLNKDFQVVYASGAGYKALAVALGLADAYVLSRPSTFLWDTCGPHALLKAAGGGIVSYRKALETDALGDSLDDLQLVYNQEEEEIEGVAKWGNRSGIIAYRDKETLQCILKSLRDV